MAKQPELFSKNPGKDFSRNRKFNFEKLLQLLVSMESGSIKHELLKFFDYSLDTITASAFYQQRSKLLPETLPHLLKKFLLHFPIEKYKNKYQLVACDGALLNITRNPNDPDTFHPPSGKSTKGYNMLHLVALYDLLSRRYLDAVIQPGRKRNEFRALCDLMERFSASGATPIFIGDRGLASYNVYAHAIEKNFLFLIRAKDVNIERLLGHKLENPDEFDYNVERILTRSMSKKKRAQPDKEEQYRMIYKNVIFDFIDFEDPSEYTIPLRVVRFKITDNTYENIVTNLPASFTPEEIKYLYGLRWGIETSFCALKHTIGLMNFHSKKVEYISQEIWARLILYDFCSLITTHVIIKKKDTKHIYQVNYSLAIKICHNYLRLKRGKSPPDVEGLISRNILPIRPGRKFARQKRFRLPASFSYRFS